MVLPTTPNPGANSITMDGPEELQFEINDLGGSNGEGDAKRFLKLLISRLKPLTILQR